MLRLTKYGWEHKRKAIYQTRGIKEQGNDRICLGRLRCGAFLEERGRHSEVECVWLRCG